MLLRRAGRAAAPVRQAHPRQAQRLRLRHHRGPLLRLSGKRTLAKLNAFDFVITVALGSTLATIVLSSSVALIEGVTALALLVSLQYVVAWASARSDRVEHLVKSEPTLLYRQDFLHGAMRRERVTVDEIAQAARGDGHADLDSVAAVVLETDGTLSVLTYAPSAGTER